MTEQVWIRGLLWKWRVRLWHCWIFLDSMPRSCQGMDGDHLMIVGLRSILMLGSVWRKWKGGEGGIARSPAGFVAAWCKPYNGVTDPLIAETLALRDGVIFAKLRGFTRVVMESDCLEAINLWNSRLVSRSVVAPILLEIEGLVFSFNSFVIQFVSRTANVPAYLCKVCLCIGWNESLDKLCT
jgi:hypothetical protein